MLHQSRYHWSKLPGQQQLEACPPVLVLGIQSACGSMCVPILFVTCLLPFCSWVLLVFYVCFGSADKHFVPVSLQVFDVSCGGGVCFGQRGDEVHPGFYCCSAGRDFVFDPPHLN